MVLSDLFSRRSIRAHITGLTVAALACTALSAAWWIVRRTVTPAVTAKIQREVDRRLGLDLNARTSDIGTLGNVYLRQVTVSSPAPVFRVEAARAIIQPSYLALLAGRLEPRRIALEDVTIAWRTWNLHLPVVWVATGARGSSQARALRGVIEFDGGGKIILQLAVDTDGALALQARAQDLALDQVPELPVGHLSGVASATLDARTTADHNSARIEVDGTIPQFALDDGRAEPIGPLLVRAHSVLDYDRRTQSLRIEDATASLGAAGEITGHLRGGMLLTNPRNLDLDITLGPIDMEAAVACLPLQLRPPPEAPPLAGNLRGNMHIAGPLDRLADWTVAGKLDLSDLRNRAMNAPPSQLASSFTYNVTDATGVEHQIVTGPESADFVPLGELPIFVVQAVTTSEDGGFWGHQGFDFDEIRLSLVEAAQAQGVVRGGSTISQQLAKNLFLNRERTLARKVREAFVTLALESALSKQRLLEIYFNVIEWGPGVYGIGPAARLYFGKDARQLNLEQAAFLASIIPNPSRYGTQLEDGEVSEIWAPRVAQVLAKMNGAITP